MSDDAPSAPGGPAGPDPQSSPQASQLPAGPELPPAGSGWPQGSPQPAAGSELPPAGPGLPQDSQQSAPGPELPPAGSGWPADGLAPAPEPEPEPEGEAPELIESLLTIWTEPRATIRRIVDVDSGFWVNRLAALVGLVFAVAFLSNTPEQALPGAGAVAFIAGIVLWPPMMILGVYVSAWMTRVTGAWLLDGKADSMAIRTAMAWSYIPLLTLLPLAILAGVLSRASAGGNTGATAILAIFGLLYLVATIWCIVIQANGVAEVQGFRSAWKGFLNVMLPGLLVFGAVFVLLFVFGIVLSLARM